MIIASDLICDQKTQLMGALQEHKIVIEQIIADLKGIDPSLCLYYEPNDKPYRDMQRELNANMWDVDRKELTKWLGQEISYPTLDNQRVNLIQVELKELGTTIRGAKGSKLIPAFIIPSWQVCMDTIARTNQVLLLFINRVLKLLSSSNFFCIKDA